MFGPDACLVEIVAASAIEAEFPHLKSLRRMRFSNLRGVNQNSVDSQLHTLAHTFKVDFKVLKAQWQDLYPRAQMQFKIQMGL